MDQQIFSVNNRAVDILDLVAQRAPVTATQFCHHSTELARDNM